MTSFFPHNAASCADTMPPAAVLPLRAGFGLELRTEYGHVLAGRHAR